MWKAYLQTSLRETIKIIIKNVYHHNTLPSPAIPKEKLEELLLLCTTAVPFRNIDGKMYIQRDSMSIDGPLGPTFYTFLHCRSGKPCNEYAKHETKYIFSIY